MKTTKPILAAALRDLAKGLEERTGDDTFTCNLVKSRIDMEVGETYADIFELNGGDSEDDNARVVWELPSDERHAVRILLLCFAAAMADTGDFE